MSCSFSGAAVRSYKHNVLRIVQIPSMQEGFPAALCCLCFSVCKLFFGGCFPSTKLSSLNYLILPHNCHSGSLITKGN